MFEDGRVLLPVLNLYVRIKIRVATYDTNNSVSDRTQTANRCFSPEHVQKLPDSLVKSAERAINSRCVKRKDQIIDQYEVSC